MKNVFLAAILTGTMLSASAMAAQAAQGVPCEQALKDLRSAIASAKIGDKEMQSVKDLEAKGIERCNADDDKRAGEFFAEAMKLLGKN